MSQRICRYVVIILGFVMAAVGLVLGFYAFPKVLHSKIDDSVKLVNGSDAFKRWETLPLPLHFKVYFFNITNPDEVQNGAKPIVNEIGPYVYDEVRNKFNITENDEALSYYQNQTFTFNAAASKPHKEDDVITVAHLPLMAIATIMEKRGPSALTMLSKVINDLFYYPKNLFLETTARDLLFNGVYIGCDKENNTGMGILKFVCKQIRREAPIQLEKLDDGRFKFSLLSYKNYTHDGHYKTNSGVKDVSLLGEIIEWNDSPKLEKIWPENSTCNNIFGTDTTIFPPHRTQKSQVNVFQSDICRSLNLHYNKEIEYRDIAGLRYVVESDMLMSGTKLSSNKCFCSKEIKGITDDDGCLLDGAMELMKCHKAPVVLTFPHFYMAHEKYRETVDGVHPDSSKHQIFVDIEPKSGTVLRGNKRVQFNIFYRKIDGIALTQNLKDSLMPIVWIEEGVELNDENINLLNDSLFKPITILNGIYWALIGVGLAIGFIGVIWCICARQPKNSS